MAAALALGALASTPAAAQKMSDDGFAIPWFRSRSEQAARAACENDLPECRDSIRRQLATEKMITRFLPWILLCLLLLGAVRYVRMREARRLRQKQEAARKHVRPSLRPKPARDEDAGEETEADDGLGFGAPGDRRR
jgi:hypothetical protein